jgi:hypothetical protein
VFWLKRTDNLLNDSIIEVSSGNKEKLNDFMILDTDNIITKDPEKINYSKALWKPNVNDSKKSITIKFNSDKFVKYMIIHGNLNNNENICNYKIIINDKDIINNNRLESNGKNTLININKKNIKSIKLVFRNNTYISEIEAYSDDLKIDSILRIKNKIENKKRHIVLDIINNNILKMIIMFIKIKRKILKYLGKNYY